MLLMEESSCSLETLRAKAELLDRACQSQYRRPLVVMEARGCSPYMFTVMVCVSRCEGEHPAAQLLQTHPQCWKLPQLCESLESRTRLDSHPSSAPDLRLRRFPAVVMMSVSVSGDAHGERGRLQNWDAAPTDGN